ncbi:MAG: TonB-dependent receptor [Halioglobus sp.]|nr:TonB-dependent receptor [Halioglobus sp.]
MYKNRKLAAFSPSALCAAIAATSTSLVALPSSAQMALEEVVVTARKREETLQEAPLAVTALSGDQLRAEGIRNLSDLSRVVPNLDVATDAQAQVYIRGVGARNPSINYDSGVGIYMDGAYLSRMQGAVLDNVDLASVQVVRGPQGTLFGKNTTGGAIIYTTNRPVDEWEGDFEVRVGNHGREDFKGTLNVPLIEGTLNSRFSAWSVHRDGYVDNAWDGSERNEEDRAGGRGQLRWLPTDAVTVDLNLSYTKTDQAGFGQNCNPIDQAGAGYLAELLAPLLLTTTGKTYAEHCADNGALGIDTVINDYLTANTKEEIWQGIATVEWELSDDMSLKSISAWRDIESEGPTDVDAVGIPLLTAGASYPSTDGFQTEIFSQELQLTGSTLNDKLSFATGLYYFEENGKVNLASGQGPLSADRLPGAPFPLPGDTDFLFYNFSLMDVESDNESMAAYAQFDWELAEKWTLSAGIRYTDETREFRRTRFVPDTSVGNPPAQPLGPQAWLLPGGIETFNIAHDWVPSDNPQDNQTNSVESDDWTPMVSLGYTFDAIGWVDTGIAYLTYSEGFLSGGVSDQLDPVSGQLGTFKPENVKNYELGVKLIGLDNTLSLNTALFYMDYTDRQLSSVTLDPATGAPVAAPINAKASSVMGLEIETKWLPLSNLELTANLSLNDGKIDDFDDTQILTGGTGAQLGLDCVSLDTAPLDVCSVDRSDEDLPRLPKYSFTLGAQMEFSLADGTLVPQILYNYRDSVEYCQDRGSCVSGAYQQDREDLSASLTWSNESWRVRLWGNNLTDDRYIGGGQFITDNLGNVAGQYNAPRTYGMDLGYRF